MPTISDTVSQPLIVEVADSVPDAAPSRPASPSQQINSARWPIFMDHQEAHARLGGSPRRLGRWRTAGRGSSRRGASIERMKTGSPRLSWYLSVSSAGVCGWRHLPGDGRAGSCCRRICAASGKEGRQDRKMLFGDRWPVHLRPRSLERPRNGAEERGRGRIRVKLARDVGPSTVAVGSSASRSTGMIPTNLLAS